MTLNVKQIYFALVSLISVVFVGMAAVELIQAAIAYLWPELVAADLARIEAMRSAEDNAPPSAWLRQQVQPFNMQIVESALELVIFGGLLWWHLPRLLRSN